MTDRKGQPYRDGELEVILSLVPTQANVARLARLLGRSEEAIAIVYRIAYERGDFGRHAKAQLSKIHAAKATVGIIVGRSGREFIA